MEESTRAVYNGTFQLEEAVVHAAPRCSSVRQHQRAHVACVASKLACSRPAVRTGARKKAFVCSLRPQQHTPPPGTGSQTPTQLAVNSDNVSYDRSDTHSFNVHIDTVSSNRRYYDNYSPGNTGTVCKGTDAPRLLAYSIPTALSRRRRQPTRPNV